MTYQATWYPVMLGPSAWYYDLHLVDDAGGRPEVRETKKFRTEPAPADLAAFAADDIARVITVQDAQAVFIQTVQTAANAAQAVAYTPVSQAIQNASLAAAEAISSDPNAIPLIAATAANVAATAVQQALQTSAVAAAQAAQGA